MKRTEYRDPSWIFPFVAYTPEQSEGKLPLVIQLHGAGERGAGQEDLKLVDIHGFSALLQKQDFPCITVMPQCPKDSFWAARVESIIEFVAQLKAYFPVDESRVFLTGLSMGGFGTWDMACTYPNLFSAAAPICGGGLTWRAGLLKDLPIRAFHGDADTCVPLCNSEAMVEAVNLCGGHAELTIFPGVDHNSWTPAYCDTDVIPWLVSQTRKR